MNILFIIDDVMNIMNVLDKLKFVNNIGNIKFIIKLVIYKVNVDIFIFKFFNFNGKIFDINS